MEVWKSIKGYENYQVSNLGRVKSLDYMHTKKEKLLKPSVISGGYLKVGLYKNKAQTKKLVHQLVAIEFLNHVPCGYKLVVNHINFDKLDNRLENLEIVTARENCNRKHLKSSSFFVGVGFHKASQKYCARIVINKKRIHLGLYKTEIEASNAYQNTLMQVLK